MDSAHCKRASPRWGALDGCAIEGVHIGTADVSNPRPVGSQPTLLGPKRKRPLTGAFYCLWRRGWDSNPRGAVMPPSDFESAPL